ncbi:MAG: phytoene desaturase family protein [Chthonomonadaceae bacterium]|nr:phytoene desaturase family protein [Chthonomonadaceae bacterium]
MPLRPVMSVRDSRPRAVVIGAGLGGLSAAIYLARAGWKVTVYERNSRSGGRMDLLAQDGFRIDMGPSMLMMPEVLERIFRDCGRAMRDYLAIQRVNPAYAVQWPDGSRLDMGRTREEMVQAVRAFAPEDADRFEAFLEAMRRQYENARYHFIERRFNAPGDLLDLRTLKGLARALPVRSVWDFAARYLKHPKMREAFTFQTLYLGISPFVCPSIYALLPFIEIEFGVWFPQGGMIRIADALERLLRELGGEIFFCRAVTRILTEGRCAVGVQTADGGVARADVVVCNMDLPSAYMRLLPPQVRRRNTDARLERMDYGCSGYLLYLGVRRIPECPWGHNVIVLSEDYRETIEDICVRGRVPQDPAMHVCIPTRTDGSLAPEGHDIVYVLVPVPNTQAGIDWEVEGPRLRESVLRKLEATGMPGLRERIVLEHVVTPPDFERRYGCYAGAAYGGLNPTFFQSAYFRPHSRSEDVDRLYFVGASTHPGGGMPIVLTSGRLAAEEICQRFPAR